MTSSKLYVEKKSDLINTWSDHQERLLEKWYKDAKSLTWKHTRASRSYSRRHKIISVPLVAIVAAVATTGYGNIDTASKCLNNYILQYILSGILMLVAMVQAIQAFLNYGELSQKHEHSASRYKNFCNSIETELVLPREYRLNGKIFVKQAQKRFNELLDICPLYPQWIDKEYEDYMTKLDKMGCNNLNEIFINKMIIKKDKKKEIHISSDKTSNDDDSNTDDDNSETDDDNSDTDDNIDKPVNNSSDTDGDSRNNLQKEMEDEVARELAQEKMRKLETRYAMDKFNNYF